MISYATFLELSEEKKYEVMKLEYDKLWKAINENGADIDLLNKRIDNANYKSNK